ncbi:hypothetical protein BCT33_08930 [Vibrio lentus]|nr:hypothetical protein BCU14_13610 [Vibrio lentus]PMN35752.1 hypothetical protein BCT33_08930 [Vibrio lentus]PMN58400.1 hypothetical protein BCT29_06380 [Vibrio lentus]
MQQALAKLGLEFVQQLVGQINLMMVFQYLNLFWGTLELEEPTFSRQFNLICCELLVKRASTASSGSALEIKLL